MTIEAWSAFTSYKCEESGMAENGIINIIFLIPFDRGGQRKSWGLVRWGGGVKYKGKVALMMKSLTTIPRKGGGAPARDRFASLSRSGSPNIYFYYRKKKLINARVCRDLWRQGEKFWIFCIYPVAINYTTKSCLIFLLYLYLESPFVSEVTRNKH